MTKALVAAVAAITAVAAALALAACGNDRAEPTTGDAGVDDDPLAFTAAAQPGSLDDLHQRILAKRCSGQPGLCHNGQFEPNLSTPAMAYAYLVARPGIEKPDRLRARPGHAEDSLVIDKLRNRRGVATQMPLPPPTDWTSRAPVRTSTSFSSVVALAALMKMTRVGA